MSEPITNTADAGREYGALPVPGSPAGRRLDLLRTMAAQSDAATAAMGVVADASGVVAGLRADNARLRSSLRDACDQIAGLESDLGGATARVAELEAQRLPDGRERAVLRLRYERVLNSFSVAPEAAAEAVMAVRDHEALWLLRDAQRLQDRVCALEAERHVTNEALSDAAVALRARPDCVCGPDGITRQVVPVQVLREVLDGEHYATVHHAYRVGHDLPETGGVL